MTDQNDERRCRLGAFLRAQRERIVPETIGFPVARRRRTPGLRREEVALRASMSATWYTRIEQGRDVSMSAAATGRLADALELGRAARRHLFELAGHAESARSSDGAGALPATLAASVMVINAPAYVLDASWTACAWNEAAAALFGDWFGGPDRNLLRYVFLNPAARHFIVDWEARARRLLAEFRADTSRTGDAALAEMIADLRTGCASFGRWWDEQLVMEREGGARAFNLSNGNVLRLHQLTLVPAADSGFKLIVLLNAPRTDD